MSNNQYSVLMSVYVKDIPAYVNVAVESMLNQTVPPEEYVIVVDGPVTEELKSAIAKYEADKELFTIIWLETNGGLGNALNIGLTRCRNELVARMDADDISLPERCERELELFAKYPKLVVCGCNIDEFYGSPDDIRTSRTVPETYEAIKHFMRKRQPFNHPTVMYKKSKVMEAGGYAKLPRKEDFDLFSRMLSKGYYAMNVGKVMYLYRADEGNYARRKSWKNFKSAVCVYRRHLMRKGCSLADFILICMGEWIFFVSPMPVVKFLSDHVLRKRKI